MNDVKKVNKLRVEYHVIDRCNLNCKACSHFSNLKSTRAEIPKSLDKIKADFQKVYELTNNGDPDYLEKVYWINNLYRVLIMLNLYFHMNMRKVLYN
mgnify:CR=1 FL=1